MLGGQFRNLGRTLGVDGLGSLGSDAEGQEKAAAGKLSKCTLHEPGRSEYLRR